MSNNNHGRPNGMNIFTYIWLVWICSKCPICRTKLYCVGVSENEHCPHCDWREL